VTRAGFLVVKALNPRDQLLVNTCVLAGQSLDAAETDDAGRSVIGTPGNDVIAGLDGRDKVKGKGGKDRICGGKGKDTLKDGGANDILKGARTG
jgi:Ca2+-binding RTX toxin-like protein